MNRRAHILAAAAALLLAIVAVAFARDVAGRVSLVALVALGGALFSTSHLRPLALLAKEAGAPGRVLAPLFVIAAGAFIYLPTLLEESVLHMGDWAIHEYMVVRLAEGLADGGHIPTYVHDISTGESPYELYPVFTYWLAARLLLILDCEPLTLLGFMGVTVHVLISASVARIGVRMGASAPWAAALGVVALVDMGSLYGGGAEAILRYGLLHQGVAHVALLTALAALLDLLATRRLRHALLLEGALAIAAMAHPLGLIGTFALVAALPLTALLTRDLRLRDALLYALLTGSGAMLSACVFVPYAERVLAYGVHYPNPAISFGHALAQLFAGDLPRATFGGVVFAGAISTIVALLTRRARPALVAAVAILLLLGATDLPFLFGELSPSPSAVRFAAFRPPAIAKPLLFASLAFTLTLATAHARARSPRLDGASLRVAGALAFVAFVFLARGGLLVLEDETRRLERQLTARHVDQEAWDALTAWSEERARELRPDSFSRVYFEQFEHFIFGIPARSKLPTLHGGAVPGMFLRERIDGLTPESIARFDLRWALSLNNPPTQGDPGTLGAVGPFFVQEFREWDGRFARVERGRAHARVLVLEDELVKVAVTATREPVLVVFGMGYYPRWRAFGPGGRELPVYGVPATRGATGRVVAAWLPPGVSELRADGPLPSDGDGTVPSLLASLVILASIAGFRSSRLRARLGGLVDALVAPVRTRGPLVSAVALAAGAVVLAVSGVSRHDEPALALDLFTGFARDAWVEVRGEDDDEWTVCEHERLTGIADCGDLGYVQSRIGETVNDQHFSWRFATPSIVAKMSEPAEVRITMRRRLAGEYLFAPYGRLSSGRLLVEGLPPVALESRTKRVAVDDGGTRNVVLHLVFGEPTEGGVGFVLANAVDRDRSSDVPIPPDAPPY
jgi:hypothetical protein